MDKSWPQVLLLTGLWPQTSVGHDMIINEADYLHVAVDEGQRAGRVSIVGFVKHIHSLQRKPKTNFKTIYILF